MEEMAKEVAQGGEVIMGGGLAKYLLSGRGRSSPKISKGLLGEGAARCSATKKFRVEIHIIMTPITSHGGAQ